MERILNEHILNYLLANDLITKHQHGFIRRRSTTTNLLECINDWSLNLQNHAGTDIIYFDYKKAFDSVSHSKLLIKLEAYGISGLLLSWINAFLYGRSQSILLNNYQSELISVTSGVPQGSVLGPTLFLLYINDVTTIFQNLAVTCKLYADDIKLYSCYTTNCQSIDDLSEAIERLTVWSQTWQLHLASNKCLLFSVKNSKIYPSDHSYMLDNSNLSRVDFIRDLGVTLDSNLKFDKHISLITHKALVRSRLILKCFHSHDRSLLVLAFCTYVRPLLEYCCAVWSPHHLNLIDKIEGVQRFFTKRLVGLTHEPYNIRLFLLNLESLEHRRLIQDLILCFKVFHRLLDTELCNALPGAVCTITRGHSSKLQKVSCKIDTTKYFLTNRIVDIWNKLPSTVVDAESVALFKKRLRGINFSPHLRYPCLSNV
jgi:ribonuclease P/MRP protein subunit RPP40